MNPEIFVGLKQKEPFLKSRPILPSTIDVIGLRKYSVLDWQRIAEIVAEHTNISIEEMKSPSRNKYIVMARHLAMYFIFLKCKYSLVQIGSFFGDRDHSTVIYAKDAVSDRYETERQYRELFKKIEREL